MRVTSPEANNSARRRRLAFVAASASLVATFAASASPIPLYNTYRAAAGITNADLSLTVVGYFVGTIGALLCLGRLSNHLGRRPASLLTLALLAAGCLVLLRVPSIGPLVAGRFLMGLGAGLASSSLTSFIVDAAPARPAWVASVVTSQAPMLGLTIGALASGSLTQYGPAPTITVYLAMIAGLVVCAGLIVASPETAAPAPGLLASLRPRVFLPPRARRLVPVAACVFVSTWAMGAFYQAFSPSIVADQLHSRNAVVVALVFSAYMAPSVVGAPIGGRFRPATAQRLGMGIFLVGMAGILGSLVAVTIVGFLIASVVAGAGQGIAVSASIRGLLHGTSPAERAPVLAATYLLCYTGAMVPSLIAGQLSHAFSLVQLTLGYGALAVIATVVTLIGARDPD